MESEKGFLIDGKVYPLPVMDTFTTGERFVFHEYCGQVQEDWIREDDEGDEDYEARTTALTRHPGFWPGLMHIAYARGNPGVKKDRVAALIESTNYIEAISALAEEGEESPPEMTGSPSEPENDSSSKPSSSNGDSGRTSTTVSDEPASLPEPTGTSESATSPTLARVV